MTLPRNLRVLRDRLHTALNALDAAERYHFAVLYGVTVDEKKQQAALTTIEKAVLDAAESIGITPQERSKMAAETKRLRDEANALRFTNARQREQIEQLTAANVRLMEITR